LQGGVGERGGVAGLELAEELVEGRSAEAAVDAAAGAEAFLAEHETTVGREESAVFAGEGVAYSGEEARRSYRHIGLGVEAVLQLRAAADAETGGYHMVGADALGAIHVGAAEDIPGGGVVQPERVAADGFDGNGLGVGEGIGLARVGDGVERG